MQDILILTRAHSFKKFQFPPTYPYEGFEGLARNSLGSSYCPTESEELRFPRVEVFGLSALQMAIMSECQDFTCSPPFFILNSYKGFLSFVYSPLCHNIRKLSERQEQERTMPGSSLKRPTIGVLPGWEVYENGNLINYLGPLLYGVRAAARERQCNLLMACGAGAPGGVLGDIEPAWLEPAPDTFFIPVSPANTDGLIIINPLVSKERIAYVRELVEAGQRIVFVGAALNGPAIAIDNYGGIKRAVTHLVEHGHRRIAFIAGSPNDLDGDSGERLQAYRAALEAHGIDVDPALIAYGLHIVEGARLAMQQILDEKIPFTAVLGSSDECAIGAMQVLKERGYRIPEDAAIIGFDDGSEALVQDPPLTSVHSPTFERGFRALELMLEYVEGKRHEPVLLTVPARLVIRQSCGCLVLDSGRIGSRFPSVWPAENAKVWDEDRLSHRMAEAVLNCARFLTREEVRAFCQDLVRAYHLGLEGSNQQEFHHTLEKILQHTDAIGDDAHVWLAGISTLRKILPSLLQTDEPTLREQMEIVLFRASERISEVMQQTHQRFLVEQQWTTDRMSSLTSHLFATLDENQIFNVLAERLPEMGIPHAAIIFYEAEEGNPFAWSVIRTIPGQWDTSHRFRTREFPPSTIYPPSEPYSLALIPLVIRGVLSGFVAFDSSRLDLYGAIVQQLQLAFSSARLYREASDGRRLAEEGRRLAEAANQMKSRFLSTVSHELRTPLTVISALSADLLDQTQGGAPSPCLYRDYIDGIHTSTQHLDGLIRDVLDLAQNQQGQLMLVCEPLDLIEVLESAAVVGEQLAHQKGLSWGLEIIGELPKVWGDRTRLRQVLLNLINNAIKFTSQGEVRVRAAMDAGKVMITVSDTGLGIPQEEQAIIFDEFRQSERTARRGYGGLGLGLAISKRLVEMHGGEISVQSTGEERAGSRFFVTLPIMDQEIAAASKTAQLTLGQTVLIVSKRPESGEYLCEKLSQQGFSAQIGEIDNTPDWLSHLLARPFGAVILDKELKSEQGWEILKTLKENPTTRDIPCLFYSLSPDKSIGSLLSLDYLKKPVETNELAQALRQHGFGDQEGKTILIVDDEPNILEMHARIIQGAARTWRVLKARDGREALSLISQEKPDLILLDLLMPELDGFGVLEAMQNDKSLSTVPVIVLTGQTLTSNEMQRLNGGVTAVLSKGVYSLDEIVARLAETLDRTPRLGSEKQRLARKAMAYVHEHYADPITRDEISDQLGVSEDYLTRCFHEETGLSFIAYLRRYRLHRAKDLLTDCGKSITEVAMAVGFSDSNYFSRAFRQETGISPSAYRRS